MRTVIQSLLSAALLATAIPGGQAADVGLVAKDTASPVELNAGDGLNFTLRSGRVVRVRVTAAAAERLSHPGAASRDIWRLTCDTVVDGQSLRLIRVLPVQESFAFPYVVNGMRLWFDGVAALCDSGNLIEDHGTCRPAKAVRLVVNDASDRLCPAPVAGWYPNDTGVVRVRGCFGGENVWMGPFEAAAGHVSAHGGLDIDQARGEGLYAPFPIDDQYLFNSLAAGSNNNRWIGWHDWPDGSRWTIQSHHLIKLNVAEHVPLAGGQRYADAAGVNTGSVDHSHFVFRMQDSKGAESYIDPWLLMWQGFADQAARVGRTTAAMGPLYPLTVGQTGWFTSRRSSAGVGAGALTCTWTFGDGAVSLEASPVHAYAKPGIYPVSLTVHDGVSTAVTTQLVTVSGAAQATAALALASEDDPSFRVRAPSAFDAAGVAVQVPATLNIIARAQAPTPRPRIVALGNAGGGLLPDASTPVIGYQNGSGWLSVARSGNGNAQALSVAVNATGLAAGVYQATVTVVCPGAANATQGFRVRLQVTAAQPAATVVIDDAAATGFWRTPAAWFGRENPWGSAPGLGCLQLTNGSQVDATAIARWTPDLAAGTYDVVLSGQTDLAATAATWNFTVRHAGGTSAVAVSPGSGRTIGRFTFAEGGDGWVQLSGDRAGVVADAVLFRKVGSTPAALAAFPTRLDLHTGAGFNGPVGNTYIQIMNTGGASATWTADPQASWLKLSATTGTIGAGQSVWLKATLASSGLAAGSYATSVRIAAGTSVASVPVLLIVSAPPSGILPGTIDLLQTGLSVGEKGAAATVTVERRGGGAGAVSVAWSLMAGSALSGSDYPAGAGGVLTWAANDLAPRTISVPIVDDAVHEGSEWFRIALGATTGGARVGDRNLCTVTVVDDDPDLPTVTLQAQTASALEGGAVPLTALVSRTGSLAAALTVGIGVSGSAGAADHAAVAGTLTIPAGAASALIRIQPVDDALAETDETVVLALAASGAYLTGAPSTVTLVIVDDEPVAVSIIASDPVASEDGDTGAFTLRRSGSTAAPLTVSFAVSGTSRWLADRNGLGYTAVIPAGASSLEVPIVPVDDAVYEPSETVTLTLAPAAGYAIGAPSTATVTIMDDDLPGSDG